MTANYVMMTRDETIFVLSVVRELVMQHNGELAASAVQKIMDRLITFSIGEAVTLTPRLSRQRCALHTVKRMIADEPIAHAIVDLHSKKTLMQVIDEALGENEDG